MIGSNSTALRQHAYSVFTASRRERPSAGDIPESVLNHMAANPPMPLPTSTTPGRADRSAEAKPAGLERAATAARSGVLHTVARVSKAAAPAHEAYAELPAPGTGEPSPDEIRRRAFEIYQSRHGSPSDPVADWLRAEAELRRERGLG